MAKRYRGDSRLAKVRPEPSPGHALRVRVSPDDVHFLMAIMHGYSHLAFPAQVNPKKGEIIFHTTPAYWDDIIEIIKNLPIAAEISQVE